MPTGTSAINCRSPPNTSIAGTACSPTLSTSNGPDRTQTWPRPTQQGSLRPWLASSRGSPGSRHHRRGFLNLLRAGGRCWSGSPRWPYTSRGRSPDRDLPTSSPALVAPRYRKAVAPAVDGEVTKGKRAGAQPAPASPGDVSHHPGLECNGLLADLEISRADQGDECDIDCVVDVLAHLLARLQADQIHVQFTGPQQRPGHAVAGCTEQPWYGVNGH